MHGLPIELYGAWPKVPKGRGDSDKKVLSFSFFRANNRDSSPLVSGENNLRPTSFPLQPAMLVSRLATSTSSVHGKTAQKGEREKKGCLGAWTWMEEMRSVSSHAIRFHYLCSCDWTRCVE